MQYRRTQSVQRLIRLNSTGTGLTSLRNSIKNEPIGIYKFTIGQNLTGTEGQVLPKNLKLNPDKELVKLNYIFC